LRSFLGLELSEVTPDRTTISRTRRLIDLEVHRNVFGWVLRMLADEGLLKGNTVAIDGTTLEVNAALRSIVKRDSGEAYNEFLARRAKESGIETPDGGSNWPNSTGSGRKRAPTCWTRDITAMMFRSACSTGTCAHVVRNRLAGGATGKTGTKRRRRFTRTGAAFRASLERNCAGNVANAWNVVSRICTRPEACGERTCGTTRTSSSGC